MATLTEEVATASAEKTTSNAQPVASGTSEPSPGTATANPAQPSDARASVVRVHVAELCKEALDLLATTPWSARTILCSLADELMWKACQIKEEKK